MGSTLEDILRKHFGYTGKNIDGPSWVKAYEQMVTALYEIGAVTGETESISRVIGVLDKIDSRNGEI